MSYHGEDRAVAYRKKVEAEIALEAARKQGRDCPSPNPKTSHNDFAKRHDEESPSGNDFNTVDDAVSVEKEHSSSEEETIGDEEEDLHIDNGSVSTSSTTNSNGSVPSMMDGIELIDFFNEEKQKRKAVSVSMGESCSFELMSLLDAAGSPRYLYDQVNTLLNKHFKDGFSMGDAMSRAVLMRNLFDKFPCPEVQELKVGRYDVYKFSFLAMLQNLIDIKGSQMFTIDKEAVVYEEDQEMKNKAELWNTPWMKDTFCSETYHNFDSSKEIMLPLIIYMDKTGTDALQRYSLEPVLFSTAAIPMEERNKGSSWRHLGFIPPCYKTDTQSGNHEESQLQMYHDVLKALLADLIHAQKHPPTVTITDPQDGKKKEVKARIPVMIVMGDQKSQDTLCGRKHSNSGGAGRVHRSCMCSYLSVDDSQKVCVDVSGTTIKRLTKLSLASDAYIRSISVKHGQKKNGREDKKEKEVIVKYLQRQRKMNAQILQFPFTQHVIRNAFEEVDFGSWEPGIFKATFDDFMHSTESGLFEYVGELVFGMLTKTEKESLEAAVRKILLTIRTSARSTFPRWQLKEGFTSMSRMTCAEKVGVIFILSITFQYKELLDIVDVAKERQIEKYFLTYPKPLSTSSTEPEKKRQSKNKNSNVDQSDTSSRKRKKKDKMAESNTSCPQPKKKRKIDACQEYPFFWKLHIPTGKLDHAEIKKRLEVMARHGFDVGILESLDRLQLHLLLSHYNLLGDIKYPSSYPRSPIPDHYDDLKGDFQIPDALLEKALDAFTASNLEVTNRLPRNEGRYMSIEGTDPKHYRRKPKQTGVGNTAAILTSDTGSFQVFMEYLLTFHAFCKYSHTLHHRFQGNHDLIEFGSRTVVQYFEKMLYRGDDSLDSRTTKVHANLRVGLNHRSLGTIMHADCQTGERLLKTKAKGVSKTAQQRGSSTFEKQTMHRVREEVVTCQYRAFIKENKEKNNKQISITSPEEAVVGEGIRRNSTTRVKPNFRYLPATRTWTKLDRKGKPIGEGNIHRCITKAFLELEPQMEVHELYGEVELLVKKGDTTEKTRIRATPEYCQSGPWYDFVQARWWLKDDSGRSLPSPVIGPGRCLGFYKKKIPASPPNQEEKTQLMVLVHGADVLRTNHKDTVLFSGYFLQYSQGPLSPKIYALQIEDIIGPIFCVFKNPHQTLFDPKKNQFLAVRPRKEWAHIWITWNEALKEANSKTEVDARRGGKLINMADKHLIESVRKKLEN